MAPYQPTEEDKAIGRRISMLRKLKGFNIHQMRAILGRGTDSQVNLERGVVSPTLRECLRFAEALHLDALDFIAYLVGEKKLGTLPAVDERDTDILQIVKLYRSIEDGKTQALFMTLAKGIARLNALAVAQNARSD